MYQMLAAGGWVMPFIVVCSVLALAISIERHFALNKQRIAPPHLLATVWQQLRGDGLDAQRLKALRQGSPLGAILAAGLANESAALAAPPLVLRFGPNATASGTGSDAGGGRAYVLADAPRRAFGVVRALERRRADADSTWAVRYRRVGVFND